MPRVPLDVYKNDLVNDLAAFMYEGVDKCAFRGT